jgi:Glycosyltransferase family 87
MSIIVPRARARRIECAEPRLAESGSVRFNGEAMRKLIVIVGALVTVAAVGTVLVPLTNHARIETTDFVNFYAAASIVHNGDGADLYHPEAQRAALRAVLGRESNQYFLHPPFEAAALAPLAFLSIERAFVVWTLINVTILGLLPLVLMPCIPAVARRPYFGLLGFCFLPTLTALTLGQDSILLLFFISMAYQLIYKKLDLAAGLVLALAAVKFQYLIVLLPLLLISRKFRVVAGLGAGAASLAVVSAMVIGWHGLLNYPRFVLAFDTQRGYRGLNPALMVNMRGFLAGIGRPPHSLIYSVAASAVLFGLAAVCARATPAAQEGGLLFAVNVAVALAAAPYAHFPDITILVLPLLLVMDWLAWAGIRNVRACFIAFTCASVFLGPVLLVVLGGHYWWNSRIYLMFPLVVLFIVGLSAELYFGRNDGNSRVKLASVPPF